jgi:Ssp1 endopeptidase immunity protein Rap1a
MRVFAGLLVLALWTLNTAAASDATSGTSFYPSCRAAAEIAAGKPVNAQESLAQLEQAGQCFAAVTAIMNLEPFLAPEFKMCPPAGRKISYGQMVLVIADHLKNHPESLDKNFYMLAIYALSVAWPCSGNNTR